MELLVSLVFGSVVALGLGLASLSSSDGARRRLARLGAADRVRAHAGPRGGVLGEEPGLAVRLLAPLAGRVAQPDDPSLGPLRRRLAEAGYRAESALVVYTGGRIALALALPLLFLLSTPAWDLRQTQVAVLLCAFAAVGLVGPSYWLDRRRRARREAIERGLPDALDLMVICVEAGLGVNASLARIAGEFEQANPHLAAEFELATLEIRAGKSTFDALRALAERSGVSEMGSLVAMLIQTERFGTSVADSLRVQADAMRVQRLQRAEEQAGKAPVKMLLPSLLIFIATLLLTIGPGLLRMSAFFRG